MYNNQKQRRAEHAEALAEQRRVEDAAPRLRKLFPTLASIRLHLSDQPEPGRTTALPYTRLIIVATAPALFSVRCVEARCDGRHDLTSGILRELHNGCARSEGSSVCQGYMGDVPCHRTLLYSVEAEFRAQ